MVNMKQIQDPFTRKQKQTTAKHFPDCVAFFMVIVTNPSLKIHGHITLMLALKIHGHIYADASIPNKVRQETILYTSPALGFMLGFLDQVTSYDQLNNWRRKDLLNNWRHMIYWTTDVICSIEQPKSYVILNNRRHMIYWTTDVMGSIEQLTSWDLLNSWRHRTYWTIRTWPWCITFSRNGLWLVVGNWSTGTSLVCSLLFVSAFVCGRQCWARCVWLLSGLSVTQHSLSSYIKEQKTPPKVLLSDVNVTFSSH